MKKIFAALLAWVLIASGSAMAANSVTEKYSLDLYYNKAPFSAGIPATLHFYKLTYDTGAGDLTIEAGVTGQAFAVVGITQSTSSNAGHQIKSASETVASWATQANTANIVPFDMQNPKVIAITNTGEALVYTGSAAALNNTIWLAVIEAPAADIMKALVWGLYRF